LQQASLRAVGWLPVLLLVAGLGFLRQMLWTRERP